MCAMNKTKQKQKTQQNLVRLSIKKTIKRQNSKIIRRPSPGVQIVYVVGERGRGGAAAGGMGDFLHIQQQQHTNNMGEQLIRTSSPSHFTKQHRFHKPEMQVCQNQQPAGLSLSSSLPDLPCCHSYSGIKKIKRNFIN